MINNYHPHYNRNLQGFFDFDRELKVEVSNPIDPIAWALWEILRKPLSTEIRRDWSDPFEL